MDTVTAVRNRILALCGEREITINKLATISALPPSSIKNILYGKSQNPKLITIKMICDGLEITLGEFFSTPEFDSLEQEVEEMGALGEVRPFVLWSTTCGTSVRKKDVYGKE